ncbi:MAG: N-acetylmuramoyl-L-alanine amidase [Alphaproteobacteria bacterium]|nr:N-acetylmuramoyl-L-alanine amidase [Alphaproteobacteria bacterium]
MWRNLSLTMFLAAMLAAALPAPAAETRVRATAVRVGSYKNAARFVVELSSSVRFKVFTLADPYRVIIDLPRLDWRTRSGRPKRRSGLISAFRYGVFTKGSNRIVIDLRRPAAIVNAFVLPPRGRIRTYRLVVDLKPTKRAAFLKNARPRQKGRQRRETRRFPRKPRRKNALPVIVLDPGHGGIDPGTTGRRGTREKDAMLRFARALRRQLLATGRYRVVMTRNADVFVRLRRRIQIARRAGGDLFISLHADAIGLKGFRGASVYTLSERASDKEAAALARKENKADIIAGIDLGGESGEVRNILIDLARRETMNRSVRFARLLVVSMRRRVRMVGRSHRFAGFAVLKAPDIPSVLVELGYLSNRADESLLRSARHHAKVARAMRRAIDRFISRRARNSRS